MLKKCIFRMSRWKGETEDTIQKKGNKRKKQHKQLQNINQAANLTPTALYETRNHLIKKQSGSSDVLWTSWDLIEVQNSTLAFFFSQHWLKKEVLDHVMMSQYMAVWTCYELWTTLGAFCDVFSSSWSITAWVWLPGQDILLTLILFMPDSV